MRVSPSSMVWSLGMSALQLLDRQVGSLWIALDLRHAEQIYEYLLQSRDESIQCDVDRYASQLVERLCVEYREQNEGVTDGKLNEIKQLLSQLLSGLLRVRPESRLSMPEVVSIVDRLVGIIN